MSRFLGSQALSLTPYQPGEQPKDKKYIKLNTNESPYPPSPGVAAATEKLDPADYRLYPDPEAGALREELADYHGVQPGQVFVGNGSDEVLGFSFFAFFDKGDKVYFTDPGYGFYPVYAQLCGLCAQTVPLGEKFETNPKDFAAKDGNIILTNPGVPSGHGLGRDEIELVLNSNPDRLVIVDEAYIDFADENMHSLPLLGRYDNLLIVRTFSKSRALAGLRLGYALSTPEIIAGIERIRYSFNSYNVNRATQAAGIASLEDEAYFRQCVENITQTRERVLVRIRDMGLEALPSYSNFILISHPKIDGVRLYQALRDSGILVRYLSHPRTAGYVRVTVGDDGQMDALLNILANIGKDTPAL